MAECGGNTANKVKHQKSEMPHGVFDIVAEYPKIQHVAADMHPAAMHEHGAKDRQEFKARRKNGKLWG